MSDVTKIIEKSLKKRKRSERNFKLFGLLGIISAITFLVIILSTIFLTGKKAFNNTVINLDVFFDPKIIDPNGKRELSEIKEAILKLIKSHKTNQLLAQQEKTPPNIREQFLTSINFETI